MKVNTAELNRQAMQLKQVANRLNEIHGSVLQVTKVLCQESIGEKFSVPLKVAADNIYRRFDETNRMRAALIQIADLYEDTEIRITDEAEHATLHFTPTPMGPVIIPEIVISPAPHTGTNADLNLGAVAGMIEWTPWDP